MWRWLAAVVAGMSMLAFSVFPVAADPVDDDLSGYALAEGDYTNFGSSYFYWVFFTTPDGRSCGMAPNGGLIGCDAVPSDAPARTNQTVADATHPAVYRHSDNPTFSRGFPVLPTGRRVETRGAACAVDHQGAVHRQTEGSHGFILSADNGVLW